MVTSYNQFNHNRNETVRHKHKPKGGSSKITGNPAVITSYWDPVITGLTSNHACGIFTDLHRSDRPPHALQVYFTTSAGQNGMFTDLSRSDRSGMHTAGIFTDLRRSPNT